MEVNKRVISKEIYISRLPGLIPPIDDEYGENGNYGKIVKSVDFSLVDNLTTLNILSYRTIIDRFYWVNNLYNNMVIYKCIQTTLSTYEWRVHENEVNIEDVRLLSVLPEASIIEVDSYVGIAEQTIIDTYNKIGGLIFYKFVERSIGKTTIPNEYIKELTPTFIYLTELEEWYNTMSQYRDSEDCCLQERYVNFGGDNFYHFLDYLKNKNILETEKDYFKSISTLKGCEISLNININNSIDNIGITSPFIEEWIPGRVYYSNEMVIYNNNVYRLKDIDGGYGGFFCELDRNIYFDELNEFGEVTLKHWVDHLDGVDEPSQNLIGNQVESRLSFLRSIVNDYDDNGVVLPGLLVNKNGEEPNKRLYEDRLDLVYKVHLPLNIEEITFINHKGAPQIDYFGDIIYGIIEKDSQITFKYVIGCKFEIITNIEGVNELVYNSETNSSGVRYEETYYFEEKTFPEVIVDGNPYEFKYKDIDTDSNIVNVTVSDLSNLNRPTIMSNSEYLNNEMYVFNEISGEWDYVNIPVFREEYLMGISSQPKINSNIFIDRGINAAFEKHLKLGEIHTLQDMEAYGNSSFFVMKQ